MKRIVQSQNTILIKNITNVRSTKRLQKIGETEMAEIVNYLLANIT